ncbi:MAG TPA: ribosome biogenesis GTPase Der [Clostridiales bacterium]|nr:ribosome biogenesis GTPase Der [Clostridiales bacterium]
MPKPIVAIVGRPNVGKSLLFNRLAGQRLAIVEDTPGVTRDRLYADCDWGNIPFQLIDTGGIEPHTNSEMLKFMRVQAEVAIEHSDVVIFLTDLTTGVTAADADIAAMLLRSQKPVVLAVNKADSLGPAPAELYEFYNLGLGDPMPVSALHGHGTGDLLDRVVEHFPPQTEEEEEDDGAIRVAIIGKPNTGKSSLLNHLTGEMRSIVSNMPGTTRDSVDALVENEYGRFLMVDTAGLRRKARVDEAVEKYSVLRALMAIERAHVCVIMIDAEEGVTEQDTKVAGYAHEKGKASVLAINKWDLIEKETDTMRKYEEKVQEAFAYMSYAPIVFISAKTGARVPTLLKAITDGYEQYNRRITTGALNDVLNDATERVQPPTDRGKRLKIYYITQVSVAPPTFVLFVNETALFHYSYKRYIENQLRAVFGFAGTPIRLIVREKGEGNDPSTFAR